MRGKSRTTDEIIAAIARRSHGVVTRVELLDAGLTSREIEVRLARGSLLAVFRGVYRVGHAAPSTKATYIAAVKAAGAGAALRCRAAGYLLRLVRGSAPPPEVTAPGERRIKGVTTVRIRNLDPRDITTVDGIPATTVARTLVDLAGVLHAEALGRAV